MQAGQKVPAIKEIIVVLHVAHLRPLIKVCQPSNVQPQRKKKKLGKKKKRHLPGSQCSTEAKERQAAHSSLDIVYSMKNIGNEIFQTQQNILSVHYYACTDV